MPRNIQIGYKLSSEEFPANELVRLAAAAEDRGFTFALISDHYHPWTDSEGQSPFVWSVLGGIANNTRKLRVGTGVTCPTIRIHPAIVAQAAATVATMMPGRFFFGVGTGENLNEHIVGQRWAETSVRQQMLVEAIQVIRLLWKGGLQSHHGQYYVVENARVYSLPAEPPPIYVAAAGPKSTQLAVRHGDGLIGTEPDKKMIEQFRSGAGEKPCLGELTVCYDASEERARKLAKEIWPIPSMPGPLLRELPLPSHFAAAAELVGEEQLARVIACGPETERHLQAIRQYLDAGYDHVCIHQVGPNQEQFMDFYAREILPRIL